MENTVLRTADKESAVRTVQVGTPEYAAVADKLISTNRQGLLALDELRHDPPGRGNRADAGLRSRNPLQLYI